MNGEMNVQKIVIIYSNFQAVYIGEVTQAQHRLTDWLILRNTELKSEWPGSHPVNTFISYSHGAERFQAWSRIVFAVTVGCQLQFLSNFYRLRRKGNFLCKVKSLVWPFKSIDLTANRKMDSNANITTLWAREVKQNEEEKNTGTLTL